MFEVVAFVPIAHEHSGRSDSEFYKNKDNVARAHSVQHQSVVNPQPKLTHLDR